ncbi:hypothetical protein F4781DRAFT_397211 [Annulohypoxylon bovei var. microspora]|nr:hypothetical protein F4781DRAFT_397211 [Annulohypoxylon bovei var. microspora]
MAIALALAIALAIASGGFLCRPTHVPCERDALSLSIKRSRRASRFENPLEAGYYALETIEPCVAPLVYAHTYILRT